MGNRPLFLIGSCFGGVVIAQVGPLVFWNPLLFWQVLALLTVITLAGARESLSRSKKIRKSPYVGRRRGLLGNSVARNGDNKHSGMGCFNPRVRG